MVSRENLVDFTKSSFFSQQHLEQMKGLLGPGVGGNSCNSVLYTERNTAILTAWSRKFLQDLDERSLPKRFFVLLGKRKQARSERGAQDAHRACLALHARFVLRFPEKHEKIRTFRSLLRKKP